MATIIDALVVTLGLDPSQYKKGQKDAQQSLDKTRQAANKTAKDMEQYGKQAAAFYTKLRNEALTFFAVLAVGGGIKSFAVNTLNTAVNLGLMSDNLGMNIKTLQSWQKAAERAGGSAAGITAQLKESAMASANFKMGLPTQTAKWFSIYGGNLDDMRDGNRYLLARAKILHDLYAQDPTKAMLAAQQMGISDDAFNLLKQGPQAVMALVHAQERHATITKENAKAALELRNRYLDVRDELQDNARTLLIEAAPALKEFGDWLLQGAKWLTQHREELKKWGAESVSDITGFAHIANVAAQAVGGWKNVLEGLLALKIASFTKQLLGLGGALGGAAGAGGALGLLGEVGAVGKAAAGGYLVGSVIEHYLPENWRNKIGEMTTETMEAFGSKSAHDTMTIKRRPGREQYLMHQLALAGYSPAQAAGIIGSLIQESNLDPEAVNKKSGAAGIGQWLGSRRQQYFRMFHTYPEMDSFRNQVSFLIWEMNHTEKRAGDAIRHAHTAAQAALLHGQLYERPGAAEANYAARIAYAQQMYGWYKPITYSGGTSHHVSSETHIGKIEVHTQATDANGIAGSIGPALKQHNLTTAQANTGTS